MPWNALVFALVVLVPMTLRAEQTASESLELVAPQFVAVSVADLDASAGWYAKTFALTGARELPSPDGSVRTRLLSSSELVVELSQHAKARSLRDYAGAPTPTFLVHGFFKAGFFVRDLDRAVKILRTRGVTSISDVQSGDDGLRWVMMRDNSGNFLQLLDRK